MYEDLTPKEKLVYQTGKKLIAKGIKLKNKHLVEELNDTRGNMSDVVTKLIKKGYFKKVKLEVERPAVIKIKSNLTCLIAIK